MSIAKQDALGPQDEATSYTVDSKSHLQISDNEYDDAEKNYQPKTLRFWFIIAGLYMSLFLVALDRTIIAAAVPRITDEFNSLDDIGWYGSSYLLTAACFFPISGRVYRLYGTRWVYLGSIVVFEVGSALCGAAPSSTAFIIGRAIAGSGSAGVFNGGMMVMIPLVPLRKRPIYASLFGMAFGVSSVVGPILGGALTQYPTWRWCFYLNLPIGAFTFFAILVFFHFDENESHTEKLSASDQFRQLDPGGAFLFASSMVCLILALEWGGAAYPWSEPKIVGLLITFGILFIFFAAYETLTPETAMAPVRVVSNRSIAGGMLFMFLLSGAMMSVIYYITIWFQATKGDTPMQAGIKTLPLILSMIVSTIVCARITQTVGYYVPAMLLSPLFCSVGIGLLTTLNAEAGPSKWIGYQVLCGIGIGAAFQSPSLAVQAVLPRADVPLGTGLVFLNQQLGGAVFLSAAQNIFSNKLTSQLSGVTELDAEIIFQTGVNELYDVVQPNEVSSVVEAYNYAITRIFIMGTALSALTIVGASVMEWKNINMKPVAKEEPKGESSRIKPDNGNQAA